MPAVTNNSTNSQDYTNSTDYPVFATKVAFMEALSDWHNEGQTDLLGLLARLANTDTDNWTAASTAGLSSISDFGKLV